MQSFVFEGARIEAEDGQSVLSALLDAGIEIDHGCKAGACQACILRSLASTPSKAQAGLDDSTVAVGGFLSCRATVGEVEAISRLDPNAFPKYEAILKLKRMATDDVCIIELDVDGFEPPHGRFIQLIHSDTGVRRPYSVASSALEDRSSISLHIRLIEGGAMSEVVRSASVGEAFAIQGPYGKCMYRSERCASPMLLISSGTGLAPLFSIITDALAQRHNAPIFLYHGGANPSRHYFLDELAELKARFANFDYCLCVDEGGEDNFRMGSPLDAALADHPSLDGSLIYLCGHPALVRAAQKKTFLAGASMKDILADPFEAIG